MTGYSGTPLAKKLGYKSPLTLLTINAPEDYREWLGALPPGVTIAEQAKAPYAGVHVFATRRGALEKYLTACKKTLESSGFVWISWPKKSSEMETDITEDVIRDLALPMGFVDIKVCAVTEVWSGLKLVIRKGERQ